MDQSKIEVTPEMIEAGITAMGEMRLDMDTYADIVEEIYKAMEGSRRGGVLVRGRN